MLLNLRVLVLMAVLIVMGALSACSPATDRRIIEGVIEGGADPAFYTLPDPVPPGRPGEIARQERLFSAPDGSVAWRVLYHTTDVAGADALVSGIVIAPDSPAPPAGRTVVGWDTRPPAPPRSARRPAVSIRSTTSRA